MGEIDLGRYGMGLLWSWAASGVEIPFWSGLGLGGAGVGIEREARTSFRFITMYCIMYEGVLCVVFICGRLYPIYIPR